MSTNSYLKQLLAIIFIAASLCFSQQRSFEKIITGVKSNEDVEYSFIELTGKGYCFTTVYNDTATIFALDLQGGFLWKRSYEGQFISVVKLADKLTALISSYQKEPFIVNINSDGKELSSIKLDRRGRCYIAGKDSSFYVFRGDELLKYQDDFTFLWSRQVNLPDSAHSSLNIYFFEHPDGQLVFFNRKAIIKFDSSGILNNIYYLDSVYQVAVRKDGLIYISNLRKIWEIDSNGVRRLITQMPFSFYPFNVTNDNGFILLNRDSSYYLNYIKLDSLGNILWTRRMPHKLDSYMAFPVSDNGIILVTSFRIAYGFVNTNLFMYYNVPCVIKMLEDGSYHSMNIFFPEGLRYPYSFNDIEAKYVTSSDLVDIYASYDNKSTWELIKSNHPGDSGQVTWKPSVKAAKYCWLKIEDTQNPNFYDETDDYFSLYIYKNYDYIAANEIKMWAGNDGDGSHDPKSDGNGFFWPKENNFNKSAIFEDGLLWGGIIHGQIRVNGNTHRQGIVPGCIFPDGSVLDPLDTRSRIFKIKKNWESLPDGGEKDKLRTDYEDWPGEFGAPYNDLDKTGVYTSGIDEPSFIGDEVMFYAANDLDSTHTSFAYGSPPIGLEFQTTIWAYDSSNYLKDVVFKRYTIINKSGRKIDSMYLGYWSDDDLGDANDDFMGCDSILGFSYTYNAINYDGIYGSPPPAVAHMFLQGPRTISTAEDSAKYKNKWIKGYKNLPVSAFILYIGGSAVYRDPAQGTYQGTTDFYNNFNGIVWNGDVFINPVTHTPTKFCINGDPVNNIGWYEGQGWHQGPYSGDRRGLISSGPFNLSPGDTQEVVIAIFMAQGSSNLNSVTELKNTAAKLQEFWRTVEIEYDEGQTIPEAFILYQNYPNPFNPSTTIRYELSEWTHVELKIYDILGREVNTLVNREQPPGKYRLEFNSNTAGLASGVYIYRLKANNYVNSKKMLLVK